MYKGAEGLAFLWPFAQNEATPSRTIMPLNANQPFRGMWAWYEILYNVFVFVEFYYRGGILS